MRQDRVAMLQVFFGLSSVLDARSFTLRLCPLFHLQLGAIENENGLDIGVDEYLKSFFTVRDQSDERKGEESKKQCKGERVKCQCYLLVDTSAVDEVLSTCISSLMQPIKSMMR